MDRQLVYPGQIPLETDLLNTNKYAMVGLSKLAAALLGTSTLVNGFTCIPTGPASLQVQVTAGEIYSLQNIDSTAYSSLAADTTHQIVKQGILLDTVTLSAPAPGTGGQSINYLVQVAYSDTDSNPVVLPYYNASNPSVAYSGPANAGTTNNTVRKGVATVSIKAGVAAATGSQVTPAPDAGNTGMFVVTVANGQATITGGNISTLAGAPFITETLTQKISQAFADAKYLSQAGTQITAVAGGTADALTASFVPAISAVSNQTVLVRAAFANATATPTINPGSGVLTIVKGNNLPLLPGDIAGAGHWLELTLDNTLGKAVLQNPANGVISSLLGKNRLINGAMALDQRNSGAAKTYTAAAALAYGIDRFYGYCTGANITGQQVAGSTGYRNSYQFTGAASVTGVGFGQRIEAANIGDLAGSNAVLSAVLSSSSLTTITWTAYYANTADSFGTLASPTRTQIATGTFTINSTPTRYSTPPISLPANAANGVEIVLTGGALLAAQTFTITGMQFEPGSVASPFEVRSYALELALCQRYYEKSYDIGVNPGTITGANRWSSASTGPAGFSSSNLSVPFKVNKRVIPTMTAYSAVTGTSGNGTFGANQEVAVTWQFIGTHNANAAASYTAATTGGASYHFTAESEL